jgi:AraC-like DNA-binding protein
MRIAACRKPPGTPMAETLFAFDEHNYRNCQSGFRGDRDQEYYLGDYAIEPASVIDVRAERKAVGVHSIIRLTSCTRLSFRRAWRHIREDGADVTVFWFVKRGRLSVTHPAGVSVAQAGEFVITRSAAPFLIECLPDEAAAHEVLHVTLPTHAARAYIPDDAPTGVCISADQRGLTLAQKILEDLLDDETEIAPDTADVLIRAALTAVSHSIRDRNVCRRLRQTVSDRRLAEVLRFIEVNLSNPHLSTAVTARGCGISPRYLSFLLKHHGATFSTLVWERRLEKARARLSTSSSDEVSISEVAYDLGFKSPAHFSRLFKQTFGANPRDVRTGTVARRP